MELDARFNVNRLLQLDDNEHGNTKIADYVNKSFVPLSLRIIP